MGNVLLFTVDSFFLVILVAFPDFLLIDHDVKRTVNRVRVSDPQCKEVK
jgi:hypothetical protein